MKLKIRIELKPAGPVEYTAAPGRVPAISVDRLPAQLLLAGTRSFVMMPFSTAYRGPLLLHVDGALRCAADLAAVNELSDADRLRLGLPRFYGPSQRRNAARHAWFLADIRLLPDIPFRARPGIFFSVEEELLDAALAAQEVS